MPNEEPTMRQWVLYDRPRDYPLAVVIREWLIVPGRQEPEPCQQPMLFVSLAAARAWVRREHPETIVIPRMANDDPTIVEVYL